MSEFKTRWIDIIKNFDGVSCANVEEPREWRFNKAHEQSWKYPDTDLFIEKSVYSQLNVWTKIVEAECIERERQEVRLCEKIVELRAKLATCQKQLEIAVNELEEFGETYHKQALADMRKGEGKKCT